MLLHQLRLERAIAVTRRLDRDVALIGVSVFGVVPLRALPAATLPGAPGS
jgi:hypothetical protein